VSAVALRRSESRRVALGIAVEISIGVTAREERRRHGSDRELRAEHQHGQALFPYLISRVSSMPSDRTRSGGIGKGGTPLHERAQEVKGEARVLAQQSGQEMSTLARILAPLAEAALVADDAGRFVFVNEAAALLTGYSVAELLRLSVWDITPADSEYEAELLWRVFLQQGQQSGVYEVRRKEGSRVPAEYAALAHVLPGLHVSMLCARRPAAPPPKRRSPKRPRRR
jgi:PAS domain S-box-containing protein